MTKAHYTARINYDEDFKSSLDLFVQLIKSDEKLNAAFPKLKNNRFSAAIRALIKTYNKRRLEQREAEKNPQSQTPTKPIW